MDNERTPGALGSNDGLGPLVDAEMAAYYEGEYIDHDDAKERLWAFAAAVRAAERARIAALIAQHTGLTLETLEYLEKMRQGPTAEEWAELDARARA